MGSFARTPGARESDITKLFNVTPTSFYQQVNHLLDTEAAYAWNPMLVRRLQAKRGNEVRPRARRLGAAL